jgi:hypothetical protein
VVGAVDRLPADRVTVQFEFRDAGRRRFWLVLRRPEVDLCLADPGFDTELAVENQLFQEWLAKRRKAAMVEWYWGRARTTDRDSPKRSPASRPGRSDADAI